MFVPFLIIRYIHTKTKLILLGVHICHPAVSLPTTPTPRELSVQKVSSMIACRFLPYLRDGATAVCLWMALGAPWLGTGEEDGNQEKTKGKRAVDLVRSGFNHIWQWAEARQDAEVTLQKTVASIYDHITSWGITKRRLDVFKSWVVL